MNTQQSVSVRLKRQGSYDILMPVCPTGKIFARLSGQDNITKPVQAALKELGYVINIVH